MYQYLVLIPKPCGAETWPSGTCLCKRPRMMEHVYLALCPNPQLSWISNPHFMAVETHAGSRQMPVCRNIIREPLLATATQYLLTHTYQSAHDACSKAHRSSFCSLDSLLQESTSAELLVLCALLVAPDNLVDTGRQWTYSSTVRLTVMERRLAWLSTSLAGRRFSS